MSSTTTPEVEKKEPLTLITLVSSDGERFEIEEAVALQSQTIKHIMEDGCTDNGIPLPNVAGKHLAKVIEYLKKHAEEDEEEEKKKKQADADLKAFDAEFVKSAEEERVMFELILAANYLNIKGLLDLTCQAVADSIKDKMPEDIRAIFNIENDFTPEEEADLRKENAWAF